MTTSLTRRRFLVLSSSVGASAAGFAACTRDGRDSAATDDSGGQIAPALALSKEPWVQLIGTTARLRFETRDPRALDVTISGPAGSATVSPALREDELTYTWDYGLEEVEPDEPGLHVLQEVIIEDLEPGGTYAWSVDRGEGQQTSGSFVVPASSQAVRIGWLADTMAPTSTRTSAVLAAASPDLVVHGGDLVYQTSPTDTWVGWSRATAALTSAATLAVVVGNHEFEEQDEIHVMFDRLFLPQGDAAGPRYCALSAGPVRVLIVDTESEDADVADQETWLVAALADASADAQVAAIIVCMHRPMFTGSKYWVEDPTTRDQRHALFVEHGVALVLCGHAHCYEHWTVDGVHYVVDGGGGALSYDPDEGMAELAVARPAEAKLRQIALRTYGVTVVDASAAGGLAVQRLSADGGAIEHSFSAPAR